MSDKSKEIDDLIKRAEPFRTRTEFSRKCHGGYTRARAMGVLEIVCAHMEVLRRRFTDEELFEVARPYASRKAFEKGCRSAYRAACVRGIINHVCAHMELLHQHRSDDELRAAAAQCAYRKEFERRFPKHYRAARKRGILDAVCSHMKPLWNFMTKEYIVELASRFETLKDFRREVPYAYSKACALGILPELRPWLNKTRESWNDQKLIEAVTPYRSMQEILHKDRRLYHALNNKLAVEPEFFQRTGLNLNPTYHRGYTSCVYLYSFQDGVQYVGYSSSKDQRHQQHVLGYGEKKVTSPVYRHAMKIGQPVPEPQILVDGVSDSAALVREAQEIAARRLAGITLLNRNKGGAGGSLPRKWDYEKVREKVLLCKDKGFNYFQKTYGGAFIWLYKRGLLRQCLEEVGMQRLTSSGVPVYRGSLESALQEAEPFLDKGMMAFREGAPRAFAWLNNHGHIYLVRKEVARRQRQRKIEHLRDVSRPFATSGEFAAKRSADYQVALRLGILGELFTPRKSAS